MPKTYDAARGKDNDLPPKPCRNHYITILDEYDHFTLVQTVEPKENETSETCCYNAKGSQ